MPPSESILRNNTSEAAISMSMVTPHPQNLVWVKVVLKFIP